MKNYKTLQTVSLFFSFLFFLFVFVSIILVTFYRYSLFVANTTLKFREALVFFQNSSVFISIQIHKKKKKKKNTTMVLETVPQASGLSFSPMKKSSVKGRVVLGNITNTAHQRTPTKAKGKPALASPLKKKSLSPNLKTSFAPVLLTEPLLASNEASDEKIESKKVIRYEIEFLKSLRELPVRFYFILICRRRFH